MAMAVVAIVVFAGGVAWQLVTEAGAPSAGNSTTASAFVGSETCAGYTNSRWITRR
jgi:hypothetical protein